MSTLGRKPDKTDCAGCHNDFYNGHNELGVTECWSLKTAVFVSRIEVHIDQCPPWRQEPITVLRCFRRPLVRLPRSIVRGRMSIPEKRYIGESMYVGVYVELENGMLKLTTSDYGQSVLDTIYLEPEVFAALVKFTAEIPGFVQ